MATTQVIYHPDGTHTKIVNKSSGCGCAEVTAVFLLVWACTQMPVLIPFTVVILAAMLAFSYHIRHTA